MFIKIRHIIYLCLITFPVLISGCSISHKYIKPEKFEWYFQTRKVFKILIDTRNPELYKKSHLRGALNLPVLNGDFKERLKAAVSSDAKDVWVVFVYEDDPESTQLLKNKLEKIFRCHMPFSGPTAIFYLQGGYKSLPTDTRRE